MITCKGICDDLPQTKRYCNGGKYCSTCVAHILVSKDARKCPCCSGLMRLKRRANKMIINNTTQHREHTRY